VRRLTSRARLVARRRLEGGGLQSGRRLPRWTSPRPRGSARRSRLWRLAKSTALSGVVFHCGTVVSEPTGNSAYSIPAYSARWLGSGTSAVGHVPEEFTPGPRATCPESDGPVWRPPGTAITGRHRNGGSRRRHGCSIEVAGHCIDGFASRSLTRTWPPRHAAAASGRVFVSRTAHSHRSTRVDSIACIIDCRPGA
jgi:hypothetical protein